MPVINKTVPCVAYSVLHAAKRLPYIVSVWMLGGHSSGCAVQHMTTKGLKTEGLIMGLCVASNTVTI